MARDLDERIAALETAVAQLQARDGAGRGVWLSSTEAAAYVPCKSLKAWYEWRRSHGIIPRANGSVAKADIDRVLNRRKRRRTMAAASLRNLQRTADGTE